MAANYFWFFTMFGVLMPFLAPILVDMGFSKTQAGALTAFLHVFNVIFPIISGRITDKYLTPAQMLRYCAVSIFIALICLWWVSGESDWLFVLALGFFGVCRSPIVPLQDTLAMQLADNDAGRYSRMRLTGSLGFAVGAVGMGYLLEGTGKSLFFPTLVVLGAVFTFSTYRLPLQKRTITTSSVVGFWRHLGPRWWLWLFTMMLHWIAFGPYNYGFTFLLKESGVAEHLTGWFWSIGIAAEVIFFRLSGRLFQNISYRNVLFLAFGVNAVRWALIGFFANPMLIAFSQLMHGPGFALFYAAALQGVREHSDEDNRASYQGVFSAGIATASIIGTTLAGRLHDAMPLSQVMLWMVPIQSAAAILLLFNALKKDDPAHLE